MIRVFFTVAVLAVCSTVAHAQVTERSGSCNPLKSNCGDAKTIGGVEAKPDAEADAASKSIAEPSPAPAQRAVRAPKAAKAARPAKSK